MKNDKVEFVSDGAKREFLTGGEGLHVVASLDKYTRDFYFQDLDDFEEFCTYWGDYKSFEIHECHKV